MKSFYFVFLALSLINISTGIIKATYKVDCRRPKPTGIESCGKNVFKGRMEKGRELNELLITWFKSKKFKVSAWRTTKVVFDCRLLERAVNLLQDRAWLGPSWKEPERKNPYYFFDASGDFYEMAMLVFATLESLKSNRFFLYYDLQFACAYANDSQTGVCSLS